MSWVIIFSSSDGVPKIGAHYGESSGSILLDDLACEGDESNLEDCDHGRWGEHNCSHSEDAGVKCCKYANFASSYSNSSLKSSHFSQNTLNEILYVTHDALH